MVNELGYRLPKGKRPSNTDTEIRKLADKAGYGSNFRAYCADAIWLPNGACLAHAIGSARTLQRTRDNYARATWRAPLRAWRAWRAWRHAVREYLATALAVAQYPVATRDLDRDCELY